MLVAIAAAIVLSPPAYRAIRELRANRLAHRALEFGGGGDLARGREAAEAAFHLAPESASSLRARARTASEPSDAFFFGHALLASGAANAADRRHYLETCLNLNLAADLDGVLGDLLESDGGEIENWLLAGRIKLRGGRFEKALDCAGRALALDAGSRQARLLTAEISLASSEQRFRDAARRALERLIAEQPDDATSLAANMLLLPDSASRVITHPLATCGHQLLAAHHQLRAAADQATRDMIIAGTIRRHQGSDLEPLLHWLNQNLLATRTLELANFELARARAGLFSAWCHAMGAAGHAAELIAIIENPNIRSQIPLVGASRDLVLVDAFEATGRPGIADVHWDRAVRDTRNGARRGKLLKLAQWASRHDYPMRAIAVYRTLLDEAPENAPHWYDRIAEHARRSQQLPLLREISAELHTRHPDNVVYQHNLAYLSVLDGEDIEQAAEILESLIRRYPDAGPARCTLALLQKQRGDDEAAAAQLAAVTPEALDPGSRYIYLSLSGEHPATPATLTRYELDAINR